MKTGYTSRSHNQKMLGWLNLFANLKGKINQTISHHNAKSQHIRVIVVRKAGNRDASKMFASN